MKFMEILKGNENTKEAAGKIAAILLIVVFSLLFLNVMLDRSDGRNSVSSGEGDISYGNVEKTSDELRLENILEAMAGVGKTEVMIKSRDERAAQVFGSTMKNSGRDNTTGVIVVAEGAGNAVTRSEIVDAVSTLCNITPAEVIVFESGGRMSAD